MAALPRTEQAVARSLGADRRPGRRAGSGIASDRREPRLAAGRRVGAVARPTGGAVLRRDLERRGHRGRGLRGGQPEHHRWPPAKGCRAACGAAASRPGSRTSWPTTTSRARRPRGGAGLHAAFCFPIRSARGVLGVIEFFTGEPRDARRRAARDDGGARRSDRPGGRTPPRRRGAAARRRRAIARCSTPPSTA